MDSIGINTTIPLWGVLSFIGLIAWALIKMFFKQGTHSVEIKQNKEDMLAFKKNIEDKLDRHKTESDVKLTELNKTSIETNTLVKLLVEDRIVKR